MGEITQVTNKNLKIGLYFFSPHENNLEASILKKWFIGHCINNSFYRNIFNILIINNLLFESNFFFFFFF